MKELKEDFRGECKFEFQGLLEQYLGQVAGSSMVGQTSDKGKGILGGPPPGFPPKETLPTSPRVDTGPSSPSHRSSSSMETVSRTTKLEQYLEAEGVPTNAGVRIVMLHLEGKAPDWHHFYAQPLGGFHLLSWDSYAHSLRERFG